MSVRHALFSCSLAALTAGFTLTAQTALTLPAGTPVHLQMDQAISSANAQLGTAVQLYVTDEIQIDGVVAIPAGTAVQATAVEVQSHAQSAKAGLLKLKLTSAKLKSGIQVPLGLQPPTPPQTVSAAVAGSTLTNPIAIAGPSPLTVSAAGKDVAIGKGTQVTAYVATTIVINTGKKAAALKSETARQPVAARPPLTNEAVLILKRAGVSDRELMARIQASPANYRFDPSDLAAFRDAGVPQPAIQAMMEAQSRK